MNYMFMLTQTIVRKKQNCLCSQMTPFGATEPAPPTSPTPRGSSKLLLFFFYPFLSHFNCSILTIAPPPSTPLPQLFIFLLKCPIATRSYSPPKHGRLHSQAPSVNNAANNYVTVPPPPHPHERVKPSPCRCCVTVCK